MKIHVDPAGLLPAAAWAWKGVTRVPLPQLAALQLTVWSGRLTAGSFDQETSRRANVEGTDAEDGVALVPGKEFLAAVRTVAGRTGTITLATTAKKLTLRSGTRTASVDLRSQDNYPALPIVPETVAAVVEGTAFARSVPRVAVSATTDQTLPSLLNIHVTVTKTAVELAASDRYRVCFDEIDATSTAAGTKLLLPAVTAAEFAHSCTGQVTISNGDGITALADATRVLTVPAGDPGMFTDLAQYKLDGVEYAVFLPDAQQVGDAVRRAAKLCGKNEPVSLTFGVDGGTIQAVSGGAYVSSENAPAEVLLGEPAEMKFNGAYLADLLAGARGPAGLGWNDSPRTAEIRPADSGDRFVALIIPFIKKA